MGLNQIIGQLPQNTTCPAGEAVVGVTNGVFTCAAVVHQIASVSLSGNSFVGGAASGTVVGAITVVMNPVSPSFSGSLSLTGTDAGSFQIVGSNLETNGVVQAGVYHLNIVATEVNVINSPFVQAVTVTGEQTIVGVVLSASTFTGGAPNGTPVGTVSVVMSPASPAFAGSLSLSGANAANFRISGNQVVTNGIVPAGSYNVNVVATQTGATGSPFTQPESLTGIAQTFASVNLSAVAFAGGSSSGTTVGTISVTMSPAVPPFSGTLSLSGTNASSFQISGGTILQTNGVVAAGTYSFNIVATQAGISGSPFAQAVTITAYDTSWVVDQTIPMPYFGANFIWVNPSPNASGSVGGGKSFATGGTGAKATPFATLTDLWSSQIPISPGTIVKVLNTAILYDWAVFGSVSGITRNLNFTGTFSNTPTGYWVIQSTDNTGTPVRAVSNGGVVNSSAAHMVSNNLAANHIGNIAVTNPSDYLIIDGMNLEQDGIQRTQLQLTCVLGSGLTHFQVRYSYIHGCSNGGINTAFSDYVALHTNKIKTMVVDSLVNDQESGISIAESQTPNGYTPNGYDSQICTTMNGSCVHYHQIISGNLVSDPYLQNLTSGVTDGNCIMVADTNVSSAAQTNAGAYLFRGLAVNNVAYNCGAAGIQMVSSQHEDIVNNTVILGYINPRINATARGAIQLNNTLDVTAVNNIVYNLGADTVVNSTGTGTTLSVDNARYFALTHGALVPSPTCTISVTIDGIANTIVAPPVFDQTNVSTVPGGASATLTLGTAVASPHGNSGVAVIAQNTFNVGCGDSAGVDAWPLAGFGGNTVTTCINWAQPGPTCPAGSTIQIVFNDSSVFFYNNLMQLVNNNNLTSQGNTVGGDYCQDCAQAPSAGPPGNNPYLVDPLLASTAFGVNPAFEIISTSVSGGSTCTPGEVASLAGGSPVGGDAASIQIDAVASGVPIATHLFHTGTYPSAGTTNFTQGSTTGTCAGITFSATKFMQVFDSTVVPDVHLQGGSPALAAGNTSYVPSHNFFGAARTSPPNIGAF